MSNETPVASKAVNETPQNKMHTKLLELIDTYIEEAISARRKAAGEGKPLVSAVHTDYVGKLVVLKGEVRKGIELSK